MKIEEIGLFPNSSVKIKNALAWFKKKREVHLIRETWKLHCRVHFFDSFAKVMMAYL